MIVLRNGTFFCQYYLAPTSTDVCINEAIHRDAHDMEAGWKTWKCCKPRADLSSSWACLAWIYDSSAVALLLLLLLLIFSHTYIDLRYKKRFPFRFGYRKEYTRIGSSSFHQYQAWYCTVIPSLPFWKTFEKWHGATRGSFGWVQGSMQPQELASSSWSMPLNWTSG